MLRVDTSSRLAIVERAANLSPSACMALLAPITSVSNRALSRVRFPHHLIEPAVAGLDIPQGMDDGVLQIRHLQRVLLFPQVLQPIGRLLAMTVIMWICLMRSFRKMEACAALAPMVPSKAVSAGTASARLRNRAAISRKASDAPSIFSLKAPAQASSTRSSTPRRCHEPAQDRRRPGQRRPRCGSRHLQWMPRPRSPCQVRVQPPSSSQFTGFGWRTSCQSMISLGIWASDTTFSTAPYAIASFGIPNTHF
jgi:hypothetical protein